MVVGQGSFRINRGGNAAFSGAFFVAEPAILSVTFRALWATSHFQQPIAAITA